MRKSGLGHLAPVRLCLPDICVMEALTALMRERNRANAFTARLEKRINELKQPGRATDPPAVAQSLGGAQFSGKRKI